METSHRSQDATSRANTQDNSPTGRGSTSKTANPGSSDDREVASLLYKPSDPISLRSVFPQGTTLPEQRPSVLKATPDIVKRRNRELLEAMRQDLDTHASEATLMYGLRSQLAELAERKEPPSSEVAAGSDPALSRWQQVEERLPRAFRFDRQDLTTYMHWSEGDYPEQSAIVRPTPSHLLKTPRPELQAPPPQPPPRTPSPLRRVRAALASGAKTAGDENKKRKWEEMQRRMMERVAKRHQGAAPSAAATLSLSSGQDEGQEQGTANSNDHNAIPCGVPDPLILSISVYSRPLLRSTRESRSRAAAQKRDSEGADEGSSGDGQAIVETEMFAPRFGTFGTEDEPFAAQRLEMYSTQTLQDLADGIVCRSDEAPEKDPDFDLPHAQGFSRLEDCMRYTGRKRPSEVVVLVEQTLAGPPEGVLMRQLKKRLPSQVATAARSLSSVTLDSIAKLRLHKPYWMCHQGICEHFWTIDEVRLPTQADPPPPQPSGATQGYRHPITTFLSMSHLDRPVSFLSGVKAMDGTYIIGMCSICEKYQAKFLVIGGEAIGNPSETADANGDKAEDGSERKRLPALLDMSESLCAACLDMFAGRMQADTTANPRRRAFRSVMRREDKERTPQETVRSGLPSALSAENAEANADISGDATWQEIRERLKREKGWTVVPLLD